MAFSVRDVTADPEVLRLLSSQTRLQILEHLSGRRMTVSELARVMELNKSTLHEHLGKMVGGGLIVKVESPQRQWVYYQLSARAQSILLPGASRTYDLPFFGAATAVAGVVAIALVFATAGPFLPGLVHEAPVATLAGGQAIAGAPTTWSLALSRPLAAPTVEILDGPEPLEANVLAKPAARVSGSTLTFLATLPAGEFWFAVSGEVDGRSVAFAPVGARVESPSIVASPSVLLAGVDHAYRVDAVVRVGQGPVAGGTLVLLLPPGSAVDAPEVQVGERGEASFVVSPLAQGVLRFAYRAPQDGSELVAAHGEIPIEAPHAHLVPGRLVAGQVNALEVRIEHPVRGPVAAVPVHIRDPRGHVLAQGLTEADGRAMLVVRPSTPGELFLVAGRSESWSLAAGTANVQYFAVARTFSVASGGGGLESTFRAYLHNQGTGPVRELVLLRVDGREVDRQEVTLAPGEGRLVEFAPVRTTQPQHLVAISGMPPFAWRSGAGPAFAALDVAPVEDALPVLLQGALVTSGVAVVLGARRRWRPHDR
ncbi:MAG TPA: winged helix-turn-helix domain-containing protein [Candidatus Thermoplasmatota archaeon]|nr:winged helix-turn-helix domain-containing protein [Candidatus Thermoplasmatota archaeon]